MADTLVPQTPPRKVIKPKRVANLTGLWEAWEENRQLRKHSRKKGSLLDWEHPSKGWAHKPEVFDAQLEGDLAFA